jgi:hypothetical protein
VDEKDWPATSRAIEDSERATQGDYDLEDDDQPDLGFSLLHALAAESEGRIQEMQPGRFYVSKLEP